MKIPLSTKLDRRILSSTDERVQLLDEIDIKTVGDLLLYFPRTHEDLSEPTNLAELRADEKNLLRGKFVRVWKESTPSRKRLIKALFEEQQGGQVECVWFNNPTIQSRIPIGRDVLITARAKLAFGKISLQAPDFELAGEGVHFGRIAPVYREHGKLKSTWFRQKIFELIEHTEAFSEVLPEAVRSAQDLMPRDQAIKEIHFPTADDTLRRAKATIAFEEVFVMQLLALRRKRQWQAETGGNALQVPLDPELIRSFFASLPFIPTDSQKIAIFEILKDFEESHAMLRLLEGDVGSGKTLVAVACALPIIRAGAQVAFLAPTEILAQQHARGITKLLAAFDPAITVALLTGSVTGKPREEILQDVRHGKVQILVGTHALLEDKVIFHRLGFVVIDEQHRFGVYQRERLIEKGSPHVLQMTATPIPRTLAIVAFGDQDLSVLLEMPPGRKEIITKVVPPRERHTIERFIESEVAKGRQAFVVCPLVEESEKLEVKAATDEFARLEHVFPDLRLGLVHGRMRPAEKDEMMRRFRDKEVDVLVSTAVVEVGVDIPNATIMLIEGAERFGLSQLHQFRGRVGRGGEQSYCFLFPTERVTDRLRAMERESCGFRLAEIDLQLRGPGQLYGVRQSGIPDMRMGDIFDPRTVSAARKAAEDFLATEDIRDFPQLKYALDQMEQQKDTA